MSTAAEWIESAVNLYNGEMESTLTTEQLLGKNPGEVFRVKKPKAKKQAKQRTPEQEAELKAKRTAAANKLIEQNRERQLQIDATRLTYADQPRLDHEAEARREIKEWQHITNLRGLRGILNRKGFTTFNGSMFTTDDVRRLQADAKSLAAQAELAKRLHTT